MYPSNQTYMMGFDSDFKRPHWKHTSWGTLIYLFFSNPSSFNRFYTRVSTRIDIGEDITVFGLLRYDVAQGAHFMDKPLAMCPSDFVGFIGQLKWQQFWLRMTYFFKLTVGVFSLLTGIAAIGYGIYCFINASKKHQDNNEDEQ